MERKMRTVWMVGSEKSLQQMVEQYNSKGIYVRTFSSGKECIDQLFQGFEVPNAIAFLEQDADQEGISRVLSILYPEIKVVNLSSNKILFDLRQKPNTDELSNRVNKALNKLTEVCKKLDQILSNPKSPE